MRMIWMLSAAFWALALQAPAQVSVHFERYLPYSYVPGTSLTVTIEITAMPGDHLCSNTYEIIPAGWRFVGSSAPLAGFQQKTTFDEATGAINWRLDEDFPLGDIYIVIEYEVVPPLGQTGPVSFRGWSYWSGYHAEPKTRVETIGHTTVYQWSPTMRWVSGRDTIQKTIDASEWGDTVLVSVSCVESIVMKPGVNLAAVLEGPWGIVPPMIEAASPDQPAIVAAPHTRISGLEISASSVGIRVSDPTVEVSNCVIWGTTRAAIEYVGTTEGKILNCSIFDNDGAGILCHEPSRNIVVSNSLVFRNAGKDIEKCASRFSFVEDGVEPGWGENNISGDPMLFGSLRGYYTMAFGSPCIDAGDNSVVRPDDTDIMRRPRIMFGARSQTVDLGSYEAVRRFEFRLAGPGKIELSWLASPGKTYSVLFSDDLLTWQVAADNVPPSNPYIYDTYWTDPMGWPPSVPMRFYKLVEE
jgi:hypothetical protein